MEGPIPVNRIDLSALITSPFRMAGGEFHSACPHRPQAGRCPLLKRSPQQKGERLRLGTPRARTRNHGN